MFILLVYVRTQLENNCTAIINLSEKWDKVFATCRNTSERCHPKKAVFPKRSLTGYASFNYI